MFDEARSKGVIGDNTVATKRHSGTPSSISPDVEEFNKLSGRMKTSRVKTVGLIAIAVAIIAMATSTFVIQLLQMGTVSDFSGPMIGAVAVIAVIIGAVTFFGVDKTDRNRKTAIGAAFVAIMSVIVIAVIGSIVWSLI